MAKQSKTAAEYVPPIEVGDRVEVTAKSGAGLGHVVRIEWIERRFKRPGGFVNKLAPVYTVRLLAGGKLIKTQSVSYSPGEDVIADRVAAVRAANPIRAEREADSVGFDGPGIRETRVVLDSKGGLRG